MYLCGVLSFFLIYCAWLALVHFEKGVSSPLRSSNELQLKADEQQPPLQTWTKVIRRGEPSRFRIAAMVETGKEPHVATSPGSELRSMQQGTFGSIEESNNQQQRVAASPNSPSEVVQQSDQRPRFSGNPKESSKDESSLIKVWEGRQGGGGERYRPPLKGNVPLARILDVLLQQRLLTIPPRPPAKFHTVEAFDAMDNSNSRKTSPWSIDMITPTTKRTPPTTTTTSTTTTTTTTRRTTTTARRTTTTTTPTTTPTTTCPRTCPVTCPTCPTCPTTCPTTTPKPTTPMWCKELLIKSAIRTTRSLVNDKQFLDWLNLKIRETQAESVQLIVEAIQSNHTIILPKPRTTTTQQPTTTISPPSTTRRMRLRIMSDEDLEEDDYYENTSSDEDYPSRRLRLQPRFRGRSRFRQRPGLKDQFFFDSSELMQNKVLILEEDTKEASTTTMSTKKRPVTSQPSSKIPNKQSHPRVRGRKRKKGRKRLRGRKGKGQRLRLRGRGETTRTKDGSADEEDEEEEEEEEVTAPSKKKKFKPLPQKWHPKKGTADEDESSIESPITYVKHKSNNKDNNTKETKVGVKHEEDIYFKTKSDVDKAIHKYLRAKGESITEESIKYAKANRCKDEGDKSMKANGQKGKEVKKYLETNGQKELESLSEELETNGNGSKGNAKHHFRTNNGKADGKIGRFEKDQQEWLFVDHYNENDCNSQNGQNPKQHRTHNDFIIVRITSKCPEIMTITPKYAKIVTTPRNPALYARKSTYPASFQTIRILDSSQDDQDVHQGLPATSAADRQTPLMVCAPPIVLLSSTTTTIRTQTTSTEEWDAEMIGMENDIRPQALIPAAMTMNRFPVPPPAVPLMQLPYLPSSGADFIAPAPDALLLAKHRPFKYPAAAPINMDFDMAFRKGLPSNRVLAQSQQPRFMPRPPPKVAPFNMIHHGWHRRRLHQLGVPMRRHKADGLIAHSSCSRSSEFVGPAAAKDSIKKRRSDLGSGDVTDEEDARLGRRKRHQATMVMPICPVALATIEYYRRMTLLR